MRSDVMPWKESSAASEQSSFIEAWMRGEDTVAGLCRRFGISRKTGHKRVSRYTGSTVWRGLGIGVEHLTVIRTVRVWR